MDEKRVDELIKRLEKLLEDLRKEEQYMTAMIETIEDVNSPNMGIAMFIMDFDEYLVQTDTADYLVYMNAFDIIEDINKLRRDRERVLDCINVLLVLGVSQIKLENKLYELLDRAYTLLGGAKWVKAQFNRLEGYKPIEVAENE